MQVRVSMIPQTQQPAFHSRPYIISQIIVVKVTNSANTADSCHCRHTPVSGPTSNTCICCYKGEEFATEIQTIFIPGYYKHFSITEKVGHVSMRVYRDWLTYGASFKCLLDKLQFLALTLCLFFSLFVFSGSLKRPGRVSVLFISDTRTGLASTHWPSPGARGGVSKGPHEKL